MSAPEFSAVYGTARYNESEYGVLVDTDGFSLSDASDTSFVQLFEISESLGLAEDTVLQTTISRAETLAFADAVTRIADLIIGLSESLGMSDLSVFVLSKEYEELLGMGDERVLELTKHLSEGISLSDADAILKVLSLSEAIGLADSALALRVVNFFDSLGIADDAYFHQQKKAIQASIANDFINVIKTQESFQNDLFDRGDE